MRIAAATVGMLVVAASGSPAIAMTGLDSVVSGALSITARSPPQAPTTIDTAIPIHHARPDTAKRYDPAHVVARGTWAPYSA